MLLAMLCGHTTGDCSVWKKLLVVHQAVAGLPQGSGCMLLMLLPLMPSSPWHIRRGRP